MARRLRDIRSCAFAGLCGVAAVLTPPDPFSLIAGTLLGTALYEVLIGLIALIES
jgi:Sec-independent protein secretion pathway component TatC